MKTDDLRDCCRAIDWKGTGGKQQCPTCGRVHQRSLPNKELKGRAAITAIGRHIQMEGLVIRDFKYVAIEAIDSEIDAKDTIIHRGKEEDQPR